MFVSHRLRETNKHLCEETNGFGKRKRVYYSKLVAGVKPAGSRIEWRIAPALNILVINKKTD